MSDILIKNMKMPKNCEGCKLIPGYCKHRSIYCMDDNQKKFIRPKDCPLIEVPPHGRLIDADALLTSENQHYEYHSDSFYVETRTIELAPTIIEKEE